MELKQPKFSYLLGALLMMALLNPLMEEFQFLRAQLVLNASFSILVVTGLYAVGAKKRRFYLAAALAIATCIAAWYDESHQTARSEVILQTCVVVFLLILLITILQRVLLNEKVTSQKIYGALCAYLIFGYVWASLYTLTDYLHPGSFNNYLHGYRDLVYYSLITLATVGYGDITPVSPVARSLAVLEAITGQFYLAVMIARLVGLEIVHSEKA